jgi:uncharacterized protein with FMN-binding domain
MAKSRPASLARRALPALVIAGASGAMLVKLDNPASSALTASSGALGTNSSGASPSSTTATKFPGPSTSPATSPTTSRPGAPATPPPTRAPLGSPTTKAPAATAPTIAAAPAVAGCDSKPVSGQSVNTRFGPVQVAAMFGADGVLCDVKVLEFPNDRSRSVRINEVALPILRDEVLAAKSADINIVSGATITSDAYATSLQSILDRRG